MVSQLAGDLKAPNRTEDSEQFARQSALPRQALAFFFEKETVVL